LGEQKFDKSELNKLSNTKTIPNSTNKPLIIPSPTNLPSVHLADDPNGS
jgi:hypothetical protein